MMNTVVVAVSIAGGTTSTVFHQLTERRYEQWILMFTVALSVSFSLSRPSQSTGRLSTGFNDALTEERPYHRNPLKGGVHNVRAA